MNERRVLSYGRQSIDEDDVAAVASVLRSDYLTTGPVLTRLEAAIAERAGAKHAVAVCNGTAALHIACLAAGLRPGKAGLTQTLTFVASANAMLYCGADAVLADVDGESLTLSADTVKKAIAARPDIDVVMPVHYAGLAVGNAELRAAAGKRVVIEDACHAFGGHYAGGQPIGCGAYADMSVFSFHPVKPVTTGEGGAIVTNDKDLARRMRRLREHGIERSEFSDRDQAFEEGDAAPWYYEQQDLGFNYRMTEMQAALGLSQIGKLDRFLARRRAIALRYDEAFGQRANVTVPQSGKANRARSGLHLYVLHVDFAAVGTTRTHFMRKLREQGVGTQVHYIPVHRQPYHARAKAGPSDFPNAEMHYARCLSIPFHPGLTDEDVEHVIKVVSKAVGAA